MTRKYLLLAACSLLIASQAFGQASQCKRTSLLDLPGSPHTAVLADGTLLATARMNINIDGYGRAYHPDNAAAGALIHLCNAGQVFSPNRSPYHGSVSNKICTGRFMDDVARIRAAKWRNGDVGAIRWYGILGRGEAMVGRKLVRGVEPVLQADGSGFYVSPTALADDTVKDWADQRRYVNPLRVPAAVIPKSAAMSARGVVLGSFGVAIDSLHRLAVPFVVGDYGPRLGEGTPALARQVAGKPISEVVTLANRYTGQVNTARITWVFFGSHGGRQRYESGNEQQLVRASQRAFKVWGGMTRLTTCLR